MSRIKTVLYPILASICAFGFSFILPVLLEYAFNYTKGVYNNPDGRMFMLPGWLFVIAGLCVCVGLIVKTLAMFRRKICLIVCFILLILTLCVIGTLLNTVTWEHFITTARWYAAY